MSISIFFCDCARPGRADQIAVRNGLKNDPRGNKSGDYGSGHEVLCDISLFLDWTPVFLLDLIVVNYRAEDAQEAFFIGVEPELPVAATSVTMQSDIWTRGHAEAASARSRAIAPCLRG